MTIYSVRYAYSDDPAASAARDEHRAAHRSFLADLAAEGTLLGSGPLVDTPGALLILRGSDTDAVTELLRDDPFQQQGLVVRAVIEEWNLILGPWAQSVTD